VAKRITAEGVALEFEQVIPLVSPSCRTMYARRGRAPYVELARNEKTLQIVYVGSDGVEELTDRMGVKDMARLLEGLRLGDYLRGSDEPVQAEGPSDALAARTSAG